MMDAYSFACQLIADYGFNVFPLKAGEKTPLFQWKKFQTQKVTEDDLDLWHEKFPDCNWAVVTGRISNLVVIDCDDQQAVLWCGENLVRTPFLVKTSRGCHLYYKYPQNADWLKNFAPKKQGINIDVKTDGGYVVAPCSVHPSGAIYMPNLEADWSCVPELALLQTPIDADFGTYPGSRNNSIAKLAGSLFAQGKPHSEVLAECIAYNLDVCRPPLDGTEVSRTVASIQKAEDRNHPHRNSKAVTDDPAATDFDGFKLATELETEQEIPACVLQPGGLLQDIADYISASSVCTTPIFAYAGAVSLLASVIGFKVQSFSGSVTNMYNICIGESGVGKDAPIQGIVDILKAMGSGLYAGSDVASAAAIIRYLAKEGHQRALFVFDEIGQLLKAAQNPNSAKAELIKVLTELYSGPRRPYTKQYATQEDKAVPTIPWHCLGIFGSSVPSEFYNSLRHGEAHNGFLARLLIWEYSGPLPPLKSDNLVHTPPTELVSNLKALVAYPVPLPPPVNEVGAVDILRQPEPITILADKDAVALHDAKNKEWRAQQQKFLSEGKLAAASIAARAGQHAGQMVLVYTASRLGSAVYDVRLSSLEDMQNAWDAVEYSLNGMIRQVGLSIAVNDFDALTQNIKRAIITYRKRERGRKTNAEKPGAPRDIIIKGTPGVPADIVDKAIDRLIQANELRVLEGWKSSPNSRRPMTLFCLVEEVEQHDQVDSQ